MPTNACHLFQECAGCQSLLRPTAGDCCVLRLRVGAVSVHAGRRATMLRSPRVLYLVRAAVGPLGDASAMQPGRVLAAARALMPASPSRRCYKCAPRRR